MDIQQLNRRDVLKGMVTVAGVALVGGAAGPPACNGPNLDSKFQIASTILNQVSATLNELHITGPLALVSKVGKVIIDTQAFYKKNDFPNAISQLNEIIAPGGLFDQLVGDVGIQSSDVVKSFLIAFRGALTVIAVILASQESNPAVAKAVQSVNAADATKADSLRKWADPVRINNLLNAH